MAIKPLSKSELRHIGDAVRDFIWVGSKPLPKVEYLPEPLEGECAWYVVMTNPRCEHRAQTGLVEKGFGVYLPQYKLEKIVKRTKQRKTVDRSLFPRYLFVWAPHGSWPRITSTDGVESLVREFGRQGPPVKVTAMAVQKLLDLQNAGTFDQMMAAATKGKAKKQKAPFAAGQRVMVLEGPFRDFYATVEKAIAGYQADILVDIFGRPTPVTLDVAQIRAL